MNSYIKYENSFQPDHNLALKNALKMINYHTQCKNFLPIDFFLIFRNFLRHQRYCSEYKI